MAFPELIEEISKTWKDENNGDIARRYSLSRSALPSLVHLSRYYSSIIAQIDDDREDLQNENKALKKLLGSGFSLEDIERQQALIKKYELEIREKNKIISTLSDQVEDLKENVEEWEKNVPTSSFLQRLVG